MENLFDLACKSQIEALQPDERELEICKKIWYLGVFCGIEISKHAKDEED